MMLILMLLLWLLILILMLLLLLLYSVVGDVDINVASIVALFCGW